MKREQLSILIVFAIISTWITINTPIAIAERTPHATIHVSGNSDFTSANGVTSGDGTKGNPYIIENLTISAETAAGILIESTDAHFTIRNCLIENGSSTYSGIVLNNVQNGTLDGNICNNNDYGIHLMNSHHNTITNNTLEGNTHGIQLFPDSYQNTLDGNTSSGNSKNGIYLSTRSHSNILRNNVCNNNTRAGILTDSDNIVIENNTCNNNATGIWLSVNDTNIVTRNTLEGNETGIYALLASNSTIILNKMRNNDNHAIDTGTSNWDNNGVGNYWEDWQTPDANNDNIVDTARPIAGGSNQDRYPLVNENWTGGDTSPRGDANMDGAINIIDALQVARYDAMLNPTPFDPIAADTDCDTDVDIIDALTIARYDAAMITEFCT